MWPSSLAAVLAAVAMGAAFAVGAAEPPLSRAQALLALTQQAPGQRVAAIERLAEIGTMRDADALAERLRDDHEGVR